MSAGERHHRRQFIQGAAQGLRNGNRSNEAIRTHHHQRGVMLGKPRAQAILRITNTDNPVVVIL